MKEQIKEILTTAGKYYADCKFLRQEPTEVQINDYADQILDLFSQDYVSLKDYEEELNILIVEAGKAKQAALKEQRERVIEKIEANYKGYREYAKNAPPLTDWKEFMFNTLDRMTVALVAELEEGKTYEPL